MELKLQLAGVLQSYGVPEFYMASRRTDTKPTLSAICGLIGNALGYEREDKEELDELINNISIVSITNEKPIKILVDDQIAGTNGNVYVTANRTDDNPNKTSPYPLIHKEYIEDNKFIVTIAGNDELMEKVKHALLYPRRPIHLGRKCCTGYEPILMEENHVSDSI